MRQVNMHEVEIQLPGLISSGEEVIIAQHGRPVARLTPIRRSTAKRVPGTARGKFEVPPEFFEPLPDEIIDAFEK